MQHTHSHTHKHPVKTSSSLLSFSHTHWTNLVYTTNEEKIAFIRTSGHGICYVKRKTPERLNTSTSLHANTLTHRNFIRLAGVPGKAVKEKTVSFKGSWL